MNDRSRQDTRSRIARGVTAFTLLFALAAVAAVTQPAMTSTEGFDAMSIQAAGTVSATGNGAASATMADPVQAY